MKPFFIEIQNFWTWADKLGRCILGHFRPNYQHSFWYSESLVHVFHNSTIISTKKLSLYIHIPNVYLRLGFEFGLQNLAIKSPLKLDGRSTLLFFCYKKTINGIQSWKDKVLNQVNPIRIYC
jgi:hypothetical protein